MPERPPVLDPVVLAGQMVVAREVVAIAADALGAIVVEALGELRQRRRDLSDDVVAAFADQLRRAGLPAGTRACAGLANRASAACSKV